jgi:hypothetical protein
MPCVLLRAALSTTLACLLLPSLALARPAPSASTLIPPDAILVLEVQRPGRVLDFALQKKVLDLVAALPASKRQSANGGFRQLVAGICFLETHLDTTWQAALPRLLGGGISLAVSADGGTLLIIDAEDGALLHKLHKILVEVARAEAVKAGNPKRVASTEVLGVTQWTFNGEEAHAILDNRFLWASKPEVLEAALRRRTAAGEAALAARPAYRAARAALRERPAATLFADLAAFKKIPAVTQTLAQANEPMTALLLAGIVNPLRDSTWLALGLDVRGPTLGVEAVADGKAGVASGPFAFTWPAGKSAGALPNLRVPRQLAAFSLHRDLGAFYAAKDKLFPERTSGLIFFENMIGIFFSGRDLTTEVLNETRPEVRVILAEQQYDKEAGIPQPQLPAFAVVFRLHHPQSFTKVAEEAWQKAIGLVNITRGQKAQAGLVIDRDVHEGTKYSFAYFSQGKTEDSETQAYRLNFRPALARVDDFLVLSTTEALVKDLIVALKKEGKNPARPLAGIHSLAEIDGGQMASLIRANRKSLVSSNMLQKGNTQEQAEIEIDDFAALIGLLGQARVTLGAQDGKLRGALEITLP